MYPGEKKKWGGEEETSRSLEKLFSNSAHTHSQLQLLWGVRSWTCWKIYDCRVQPANWGRSGKEWFHSYYSGLAGGWSPPHFSWCVWEQGCGAAVKREAAAKTNKQTVLDSHISVEVFQYEAKPWAGSGCPWNIKILVLWTKHWNFQSSLHWFSILSVFWRGDLKQKQQSHQVSILLH